MRLEGKRALVTGGASGIGKGIAARFLKEGASVLIADKNSEGLIKTAEQFKGEGHACEYIVAVLSDRRQLDVLAEHAWSCWGGIDILVNNAGVAVREPFVDIEAERWDQIMEVNLNAIFFLTQKITRKMIDNRIKGSIVNMASKNGVAGSSALAHYNTSKGGIILLTQSMAVELAAKEIRVNALAPGFIETPLDQKLKQADDSLNLTERTPMQRVGTVEEVANCALFLASDEASYVTGSTLVVDGGHLANASEL
ncbi:3-oxoacyl-[acyl-carrier-protein] reductase FabG [Thalassobacillus devorans]|uniref:3-oxoacyl-[acyl-carrier-protein] reductase FabG n=1 Tax=Thalassobacillus devorans TaxID=279813 RepID=A0ABQ1P290_9BACI|nr:SDR family oxidoreductase [Thalassobacillus devorans]NIK28017.1 NAD(P)-dependent dehydrogenase (short-subunit alcohol dehydrogenase family) [Thalassobacillus devorans]GGC89562.1 3-oxoacyl-[acyl-carrier-protein] reductase FabG [Thalassobacillus devorans]